MDEKNIVLAILFATGDKIEEAEIARIAKLTPEAVKKHLIELKKEYASGTTPFVVLDESPKWKFTVREDYMEVVQQIVPHTELNKALMETLAVIAWKAPVLQSDIINIRSNKAYDHIKELEEMGFVTKKRHGRSYMLRLAQRFYEYFDLKGKEDIEKRFEGYRDISEADVILKDLEEEGVEPYGERPGQVSDKEEIEEADDEKLGRLEVFEEPDAEERPEIEVVEVKDEAKVKDQAEIGEADEKHKEESPESDASNKIDEITKKITKQMEELQDKEQGQDEDASS